MLLIPYFNDEKYIIQLLNKNINLIHHAEEIKRIYFFGAGASSDELKQVVHNAFSSFFKFAKISVGMILMRPLLPAAVTRRAL
jgi:glucosamine kinase